MSVEDFRGGLDIPGPLKQAVVDYYHKYEDFYAEPWRELDETHQRFESNDRRLRTSLFTLSYLYAVLSIQTPIDAAERQFWRIYTGESVEEVVINSQQITAKANAIYDTLDHHGYEGMAAYADRLVAGQVDAVVADIEREYEFKYVGPVKAPFVVAQLGYTSQMCIDSNVQGFLGIDFGEEGVTGEKVTRVCATVEDLFPGLMREVKEPYHLQWILFNFARVNDVLWEPETGEMTLTLSGAVAVDPIEGVEPEKHDRWFDATLDDRGRIVERVRGLFEEAPGAEY